MEGVKHWGWWAATAADFCILAAEWQVDGVKDAGLDWRAHLPGRARGPDQHVSVTVEPFSWTQEAVMCQ